MWQSAKDAAKLYHMLHVICATFALGLALTSLFHQCAAVCCNLSTTRTPSLPPSLRNPRMQCWGFGKAVVAWELANKAAKLCDLCDSWDFNMP